MNPDFTKAQRRRIRELGALAYERELSEELAKLEAEFKRWRAGEIDAFQLSEAIHRFHQGASRELFTRYDQSTLEIAVAQAIHRGIVSQDEAGADTVALLGNILAFLREQET
jgi:hypothetical protein